MGKLHILLGAMLACAATAGTPTPFAPPTPGTLVLYRHATLIDGAAARPDTDVLVDGERIRNIGPSGTLAADKAQTIDLSGRFLMPGLIDSHVHLATPPNRRQADAILRRDTAASPQCATWPTICGRWPILPERHASAKVRARMSITPR